MDSKLIIYKTEDGLTRIETTFDDDTVWLFNLEYGQPIF